MAQTTETVPPERKTRPHESIESAPEKKKGERPVREAAEDERKAMRIESQRRDERGAPSPRDREPSHRPDRGR
jgi:hypothetical protein